MNRHRLHLAILIALLGAFATGAGAQSTAGAMPASPESAATAAAKSTTGLPTKPKTAGTHSGTRAHHASANKAKHAKPAHHERAMPVSAAESAYRTALRRCVAGPTAARDECLDQVVAQHARGDGRVV